MRFKPLWSWLRVWVKYPWICVRYRRIQPFPYPGKRSLSGKRMRSKHGLAFYESD